MNQHLLQWKPKPGQMLLYIDLSEVKSHSVTDTLNLLEQLGYNPQLRYTEDEQGLKLYALLKDEQHDPTVPIPAEYLEEELEILYEALAPEDIAIRNPRGLPPRVAIAS